MFPEPDEAGEGEEAQEMAIREIKKREVRNLHEHWLVIRPSKAEFISLINNCFNEGLESI